MEVYKVLNWIKERQYEKLPYKVQGAAWGPKVSKGKELDEYGLIFYVEKKLPIHLIPQNEIIPAEFNIDGDSFVTDVQKTVEHKALLSNCHDNSPYVEPVMSNRKKRRPLQGGASTIFIGGSDATLGLLVRDKTDGQVVALSNCHVFGASQVATGASRSVTNSAGQFNTSELSARQPGAQAYNPYGSANPFNDFIGTCKRPIVIGDKNPGSGNYGIIDTSADAAIIALSGYDLIYLGPNNESARVINFSGNPPFKFASDEEINSLLDPASPNYRSPVFRSGRTGGPIGAPGYAASCNLSAYQLGVSYVGYFGGGFLSYFPESIYVRGNVSPGFGGDSGSTFFALLSSNIPSLSTWKVIGLLFAGPQDSTYMIGCRITNIVDALDIAPWDCTLPTVSSLSVTFSAADTSSTITLSGRKYYQIGCVPSPTPTTTQTPTVTPTITQTPTVTYTQTTTPTNTPTPTITPSVTPTITPTISLTPSITPSRSYNYLYPLSAKPTPGNSFPPASGPYVGYAPITITSSSNQIYTGVAPLCAFIWFPPQNNPLNQTNTIYLKLMTTAIATSGSTVATIDYDMSYGYYGTYFAVSTAINSRRYIADINGNPLSFRYSQSYVTLVVNLSTGAYLPPA